MEAQKTDAPPAESSAGNSAESTPGNPSANPPRPGWQKRSLVLVGMMGSGKTTIGRRLAHRLRWPFVDTDAEIELAAGMPIKEIFSRFGEAHFRDGEHRVIRRIFERGRQVIATGGGAFCNPETRALILSSATVIWLDADLDTLVARVSRRDTRPLLSGQNPREVLAALLEKRRPFYAEAHIHVHSRNGPHQETVSRIVKILKDIQQQNP